MDTGFFSPTDEGGALYKSALGSFATGVGVVTINNEGVPAGLTINSFVALSEDPPLVMWSLDKKSRRYLMFSDTQSFNINILSEEQIVIAGNFTRFDSDFDSLGWRKDSAGVPEIENCVARFQCSMYEQYEAGDHLLIVGHVKSVFSSDLLPLCYCKRRFGRFNPMP